MCEVLFPEYISAAALPRERSVILREDKLPRFDWRFVVMLTLPYYVGGGDGTLAEFASHKDYHAAFEGLERSLSERLSALGIKTRLRIMTDNSPLDEVKCAALAGLGMIGRHGMLITPRYSSYVFIGEMFTELDADELASLGIDIPRSFEIGRCSACGRCAAACVGKKLSGEGVCLSEITQKKRDLTETEAKLIAECGSAWGCDVCAEVCPHTVAAKRRGTIFTRHPDFISDHITGISSEALSAMSDDEFLQFAFAWRPRRVIERNIKLIEEQKLKK